MLQLVLLLRSLTFLRNSCNAVWKSIQHQQLLLVYLLCLLSQYQICECNQTNPNHRIQRRFMWKEMDVVDSMLRRMVSGSRFIKNIIGETTPKKYMLKASTLSNYLPIETTKVKYIFKDPLTKQTKVITMRPSQKIIRPTFDYLADNKPKTSTVIPKDKIRQMERDKEVLAEKQSSKKVEDNNSQKINTKVKEDEVVRGKISELGNSWQPIQSKTTTPSTVKSLSPIPSPKAISQLHTSFITDAQGEKLNSAKAMDSNEVTSIAPHTYEVTENDSEETVHLPFTNEYLSIPMSMNNLPKAVTETTATVANTDNDGDYLTQSEFIVPLIYPSPYNVFQPLLTFEPAIAAATTTLPPIIVTTTTDDETPNYPTYFLQRIREQPQSSSSYTAVQNITSTLQSAADNNWKLDQNPNEYNSNSNGNNLGHQLLSSRRQNRRKPVNWTASAETDFHTTSSSEESLRETTASTESTQSHSKKLRKNAHLKSSTTPATTFSSEETSRSPKQRGSVKFGSKIRTDNS